MFVLIKTQFSPQMSISISELRDNYIKDLKIAFPGEPDAELFGLAYRQALLYIGLLLIRQSGCSTFDIEFDCPDVYGDFIDGWLSDIWDRVDADCDDSDSDSDAPNPDAEVK